MASDNSGRKKRMLSEVNPKYQPTNRGINSTELQLLIACNSDLAVVAISVVGADMHDVGRLRAPSHIRLVSSAESC